MPIIENTALFDFKQEETANKFFHQCCTSIGKIIDLNSKKLQVTDAEQKKSVVKINIYGDDVETYWSCFEFAERNLHSVAFLGSFSSSLHFDWEDVDALMSVPGATLVDSLLSSLHDLYTRFIETVDMMEYSRDELQRIVHMCHFGVRCDVEDAALDTLLDIQYYARQNTKISWDYMAQRITKVHHISRSYNEAPAGDKVLQRSLLHLLFLDKARGNKAVTPSPLAGIKRMFLG